MRKSLLPTTLNTSFTSSNANGRCTDFIALVDHADLADTSKFTFAEHVNQNGRRVFELNNPIKSDVRHIGTEDSEDGEFDYCVAFFNRRTKQTEYKPISLLRVAPRTKRELENTGFLEARQRRSIISYGQNNSVSREENWEKRKELVMEFGNTKKRKLLEASERRKIGEDAMSTMNISLMDESGMNNSTLDGDTTLNTSTDSKSAISMLKTATSMVLPKMNMEAKAPDQVFKLEDFFETKEENANSTELDDYKYMARGFFGTHSTMDKLCELGVPKFIAIRIMESYRSNDVCAAAALKLALLSIVSPRGRVLTTNINFQKMEGVSPQVRMSFESQFIHGRINMKKECVVERIYKDKMIAHIFGLYFALSVTGNYILPLGWVSTELQFSDGPAKKMLQSLGCMVQSATQEEIRTLNTTQIARLVGPLRAGMRGGRGSARGRRK